MSAGVMFQCGACRALGNALAVVVDADGARGGLVCPACGQTTWLPVSAAAGLVVDAPVVVVRPPPPPVVEVALALVPSAVMTPSFDDDTVGRMRERIARLPPPAPSQLELGQRFEQLLSSSWSVEAHHKKLLKSAAAAGELAFVGSRYRAVLDVVRDEPRAKAAQQELLTLAMATMAARPDLGTVEKSGPKPAVVVAAVVLIGVLVVGGVLVTKSIAGTFAAMNKIDQ